VTSFIIFAVFIVVGLIVQAANKKKAAQGPGQARGRNRNPGTPSPRVQKLIERMQAQQGTNQPIQFQGQFTQPTSGPPMRGQAAVPGQVINSAGQVVRPAGPVQDPGRAQASAQMAGMLQQLMQTGQAAGRFGQQITGPGQNQSGQFGQPGMAVQPGPYGQVGWIQPPPGPAYQQPVRRPQQSKGDLDTRIRQLMSTGNEVTAVRLLSDERDLGIIEAQKYARSLVAGPDKARSTADAASDPDSTGTGKDQEEFRYVGSAAFAESLFDTRGDENFWASGWVDKPEPEDRSDMDELWQTVQNAGRPKPPAN
jgi:hypothetical protein